MPKPDLFIFALRALVALPVYELPLDRWWQTQDTCNLHS